jgi:DNA-binding LacI/PurR family transcriptional regulator
VPRLSAHTRAYLSELESLGIVPGPFNLPDWDEDTDGLQRCLSSLFQVTPPTALILDEPALYFATTQFLMSQGIRVPRDVSLACTDHDPHFAWCKPSVAQIKWNSSLVARRVLRWTNHLAQGRSDRHLTFFKTRFIPGETIGPARRK